MFADPERQNVTFADQFLAIATASSVRDDQAGSGCPSWFAMVQRNGRRSAGEVLYANISVAANITDAQLDDCTGQGPARAFMDMADVTVLDGARSACGWTQRSAMRLVLVSFLQPFARRSFGKMSSGIPTTVTGLTASPDARLTGLPKVIGPEQSTRGERTRMAAMLAREMIDDGRPVGSRRNAGAMGGSLLWGAQSYCGIDPPMTCWLIARAIRS